MKKGFHHTEETKAKISLANKGKQGRVFSEEEKAIFGTINIGRKHTEEARANMSKAHKGIIPSAETRTKMSKAQTGRVQSPEARAKIGVARKGKRHTDEAKAKISRAKIGIRQTDEVRAKKSIATKGRLNPFYGKTHTEEANAKNRLGHLGREASSETRARLSLGLLERWRNLEYKNRVVKAIMTACNIHPNKPESILLALLDNAYPNEWAFVGDGTLVIDGFNPDFVNVNGKKQIIEMFGDYWHGEGSKPNRRSDEERIRAYASLGYSTLIIWASELKNPEGVLIKIKEFVNG